jgi:methionyl-tRNA formyltransferase
MRLVMMGTGTFALPTFLGLYETQHEVAGLFTQPDRGGRGRHRHVNSMKEAALERGTPVFQPENVNAPEALDDLRSLDPDLCVVAAYGQILRPQLLEIPRRGAINVHASLLPKYRGAAPIQYAILNGETETGVTIFQIEPKLDAGPILGMVKTPIGPKETAGELEARLADLAAPLTRDVIAGIEAGTIEPVPQNPAQATKAPRLKKEQGAIDWTKPAAAVACHVRAMQPWPTPYTFLEQPGRPPLRLILLDVEPCEPVPDSPGDAEPGTVLTADGHRLVVRTGEGAVEILELRPEGKRAMTAAEFLRGHRLEPGDRLTNL